MAIDLNFNNSFSQLPDLFYRRRSPQGLREPQLVSVSSKVAGLLGLSESDCKTTEFLELFSGNRLPVGSDPLAMVYSGHQFGVYVPQLGDGRAVLLGEVEHAGNRWDLQLKGAGYTPFSRMADGRAVLRSCIREYLCSEAIHALGIPTTRALCVTVGSDPVYREQVETAAMMTRVSPSHVRFGSFEYFYYTRQYDALPILADYVIERHFGEWRGDEQRYRLLFEEVVRRTAHLIAQWQAVGFAHGVMNSDNMSILGLTLDYGPFGFMEKYDPGFICNHSDHEGRYAFNRQPVVGLYNLNCLAHAFTPLLSEEVLTEVLSDYETSYIEAYQNQMNRKLGLVTRQQWDDTLVTDLLQLLHAGQVDYTNFFRSLCRVHEEKEPNELYEMFEHAEEFRQWLQRYLARVVEDPADNCERLSLMRRSNPKFVLRNYLAQQAIEAAQQQDFSETDRLLELLGAPGEEWPGFESYAAESPDWAKELTVSCSS